MIVTEKLLDKISFEHGSSFYLLDSERFKCNFIELTNSFRKYYKNTSIAYSYKTNYVPRYCKIVNELGGYAEIVSSMEMSLALKLGVPAKKIFFNGPYKEINYVIQLLKNGGVVNIDSIEELMSIISFANNHKGGPFKVGIRCNFDIKNDTISRFGIDVESNAFIEIIDKIENHPNLKLVGLHCHFPNRNIESWRYRTLGMISVIDRFFKDKMHNLEQISLGGGIYGHMPDDLKSQFPFEVPNFDDYAQESAKVLDNYINKNFGDYRPLLIIEPGTALVADALRYACRINSIKNIRGRFIITLTGSSYNINPNPNRKNVPIQIFNMDDNSIKIKVHDAYFAGYTCIEGDYLYKGFEGEISIGDFIVFDDAGSYSIVMKPPFILPNVSIIEPINDSLDFKVIKRKETFDDIFNTYNL